MECATSFNVTGVSSCFLVLVDFEVFAVLSDAGFLICQQMYMQKVK